MAKAKIKKAPAKPALKSVPAKASSKKGSAGSDVERRWKEYWACRKQLEDSVEKVRVARETLQKMQDEERTRRSEFDVIRRSLTALLDVDPANAAAQQRQQPTALPQPVPPPPAAQGQGPKQGN